MVVESRKPTRWYSNKQENKVAKAIGGKKVANSGATSFNKGDVALDNWLIECKTSTKNRESFTLKKEWFDKNKEESFAMHKDYSALVFDFGDGEQHYVINERLFKQLINYLEREEQ